MQTLRRARAPRPHRTRADAERNARLIVDAARAVFAKRGLEAPLEEISERACVGIATLYRHFPTRDDLIGASFEDKVGEYAGAVRRALEAEDAWSGFGAFVYRVCEMQAQDRGLADVLTLTFPTARSLEAERTRAYKDFAELIRRAKRQGKLRNDFVSQDLVLTLMANAGVIRATRDHAPGAWKRFAALMIEAFRADRAGELPPAPTAAQTYRAMLRAAKTGRVE